MTDSKTIPIVSQLVRMIILLIIGCFIVFKLMDYQDLFNEEYKFGMENTTINNNQACFVAENGYCADNAFFRTEEVAFEGKYAIKLDSNYRYGLSTSYKIPKTTDSIDAFVWIYSTKIQKDTVQNAFLVASIGDVFWKGSNIIEETKLGWHKLHFKFSVPEGNYNQPLTIYCWNNNNYEVFFDNLTVYCRNYRKYF